MNSIGSLTATETRKGYWWRVLRPLFWWLLLVLALTAIHQHQLAMERTRIFISITMYQTNVLDDAVAVLDGRQIANGDKISLGSHRLTITQAKAEPFTTNFTSWYGPHDLGKINLKRATGTLAITAEPIAKTITISGPELWLTLNNSGSTNIVLPTDHYNVSAQFARLSDARNILVTAGNTTSCAFAPQLGAISVTCNEPPATYQLQDGSGNFIERGNVPALITDLAAGRYFVSGAYHDHTLNQRVVVTNRETNSVPFHFVFGAARLESVPPGASVYSASGVYLGVTPAIVSELSLGVANFRLELNGYDNATISITVAENKTNVAGATLVSLSYLGSMRAAQQDMQSGNYGNALADVEQALVAKPGDADAFILHTNAQCRELVQQAKDVVASRSDYIAADAKLQGALLILPDDAEAKQLLAEYQPHEAAEIVQIKAWKTRQAFDNLCREDQLANLFGEHQVTIKSMTPEVFHDALLKHCETVMPTLAVLSNHQVENGIFRITMKQASDNPLVTARRDCLMVIGTDKSGQTVMLFKMKEFQRQLGFRVNFNALNSVTAGNPNEWIPLHPSRIQMIPAYEEQIRVGVKMLMNHVNAATGVQQ